MIRNSLITWRDVTERLIQLLDIRGEEKRETVIQQIEKQLDERDKLQISIKGPFSKEEEVLGEVLLLLESGLQEKLAIYMKDVQLDISGIQKKKVSMHAYMDPYDKVFRDGTFYDKKK